MQLNERVAALCVRSGALPQVPGGKDQGADRPPAQPGVAGAATESLEATAARFAAMMADVMPTTEEAVENLKRVTAQLDFVGKQ